MPMLYRQNGPGRVKAVLGLRLRKFGTPKPFPAGMAVNDPHRCRCVVLVVECDSFRGILQKSIETE